MVVTNSLPGDIARDFMQIQGYRQTFFPGHDAVALDLLVKSSGRSHYVLIMQMPISDNARSFGMRSADRRMGPTAREMRDLADARLVVGALA